MGLRGPRGTLQPSLTSWACRRLAFHSWRMTTSHCWSVAGLHRCRGSLIAGGTPGTCLPLCRLPATEVAAGLELSTLSLKQPLEQTRGGLPEVISHTPSRGSTCSSVSKRVISTASWGPGSLPPTRVLQAPGGGGGSLGLAMTRAHHFLPPQGTLKSQMWFELPGCPQS